MDIGTRYGIELLFDIKARPDTDASNDPLEVTNGAALASYLANIAIGSHSLDLILTGSPLAKLMFSDKVYMFKVVSHLGSGVNIRLSDEENIRRAVARRYNILSEDVTSEHLKTARAIILLRGRHNNKINNILKTLAFQLEDIDGATRGFFSQEGDDVVLTKESSEKLEKQIKKTTGILTLENKSKGGLILIADGDLMPINAVVDNKADIIFGAGGTAEAMISARMANGLVDFSGRFISHAKTKEGKADALQVDDPQASLLTDAE